ncbi:MAG TPA: NADH-quinone oxidoreductase subunit NuoN [Caulobacteraceae bacterium]|jgi:NADH-quinone oxidoreductase subunit N|nr:NADH-quinone oxidoreductase subunit NuoN [Caulobacteraceae bacterium]
MNAAHIAALAASELLLVAASLSLLLWGAFARKPGMLFSVAATASLIAAAVVAAFEPTGRAFLGGLVIDDGAVFSKVVIYLASAAAVPLGDRWFARRGSGRFEYPILIVIAALGMGMMVSAGDLISLFISIELQSLANYVLAAFDRDDAKSSEAGLKYFVLGALSSGIMLYGASLVYGFAGSTRFEDIAAAMSHGAGGGALLGLVFLICGIAFKVSAAPFHMWTPDVYEGAPTPVVGFFAGAPKLAAMVLLARLLTESFPGAVAQWRQIIVVVAVLSVAVGALAGLRQTNLKRLWAYSSIANIGYAMVGLAAGGAAGVQSMLVFMTLYVIDVTGFFACLAALSREGRPMENFADFSGLVRERPGLAIAISFFALSGLGLPPFSGLWSKFYVFKAAIAAGLAPVAVIALIGSVIAAYYYLRLVKVMWLDPSPGPTDRPAPEAAVIAYTAAFFAFPAVLVALIAIDPLAQQAAAALVRF